MGEVRQGEHRLFTGFARDLTERQEAQDRVQQLQSELMHVSRLTDMGQMATTIAHEVNQPLAAIGNYMEAAALLLERGGEPEDSKLRQIMQRSGEQAVRAGQIIHRLRAFLSRGEPDRRPEPVAPLIREAAELALLGIKQNNISIDLQPDLPEAEIFADKVQIQQVLVNLLRNAADAVADQDEQRVALRAEKTDGGVLISVSDNGPGLTDEVQCKLFEPFLSTKTSGMGVGLSVCKTIVTSHKGRIWAEQNPGGGTIFRVLLPLAPNDLASAPRIGAHRIDTDQCRLGDYG